MWCMVDKMLWVFQILVLSALGFKMRNLETKSVQLFLRNNGELEDSSRIPTCEPGNKIFLNSFAYNRLQCSRFACNIVHEEALSQITAFQLHQNCSFRQKCQNLNFPVHNVSSYFYAVTIQYQCLDEESLVLDMCAKHEMMFNRTLHLLFKNYSQNLKNCECWVNKAPFSPVIMELRLNSRYKDKCSASRLLINEHHYMCDSKSDSYGAIFGEALYDDLPLGAFISLVHNSDMEPPGMVWIALIPDGTSRLMCSGDGTTPSQPSNMATTPTRQSPPISYPSPCSAPENNNTLFWVVIGVLASSVIALLICVLWLKRENGILKRKSEDIKNGRAPPNSCNKKDKSKPLVPETTLDEEVTLLNKKDIPGYPGIIQVKEKDTPL